MNRSVTSFLALTAPALFLMASLPASAQTVEVIQGRHAVSEPMSQMAQHHSAGGPVSQHIHPLLPGQASAGSQVDVADPVAQETAGPMVSATIGNNVLGLGAGFPGYTVQFIPSDTNASVGTTQVVETVNTDYAVFLKSTGAIVAGPTSIPSGLFANLPGGCGTFGNVSDPVVLFDKAAQRWVVEIITVSTPYQHCFAVSTSSDATGSYNLYSFTIASGLPDYAKVGVWSDAYYVSSRLFSGGSSYVGPMACAADRTKMLAGAAATMECKQVINTAIDGMLPSDLDGATAPPTGSPNFYLIQGTTGTHTLQLYKFHVDFAIPANTTFTGPTTITVANYTQAASSTSVPQSGTTQKLDALGNFLMHRLSYRNFGTYESLVVSHSVSLGSGTTKRFGMRWYELRSPNAVPVVFQQGTFSPNTTTYRWMGSIAQDKLGDMAMGYSVSSQTLHPEIRYTGRVPSDLAGKMETEATIFNGTASQTGFSRWGDYSSMSIDPVDDCTFWYATEYSTGSSNWATRLASIKFPTCQ